MIVILSSPLHGSKPLGQKEDIELFTKIPVGYLDIYPNSIPLIEFITA